jgi:hypothetical protein
MGLLLNFQRIVVGSLLAVSVSACSALPGGTSATTIPSADEALKYFEELAKKSRVGYESAIALSVGDAREYAKYLNESLQAFDFAKSDGENFEAEPLETARIDESGRIVSESTDFRITFSDFKFSLGKLIDFNVEGRPLSQNLVSGVPITTCRTYDDKCNSPGSFDVDVLHAYIGSTGNLNITYSARQGEKYQQTVRTKSGSGGLPKHLVLTTSGSEIKSTGSVETFAKGETRINYVQFGPLNGGGGFTLRLKFNSGELKDTFLGKFLG